MGGHRIPPVEFLLQATCYSRRTAITASIKIGGYYMAAGTIQALRALLAGVQQVVGWLGRLPRGIQFLLVALLILSVAHPKSRKVITDSLQSAGTLFSGAAPILVDSLRTTAKLLHEDQASPPMLPWRSEDTLRV